MRRGFTLPEVLSAAAIVGILAAVVTPPLLRYLDRAAVREGVERYAALHASTRQLAISRSTLARLEVDRSRPVATLSVQRSSTAWDTVGTVTCEAVNESTGDTYPVSEDRDSRGWDDDTVNTVLDQALDDCYAEANGAMCGPVTPACSFQPY